MKSAKIIAVAAALGVMSVSAFATTVGYVTRTVPAGSSNIISPAFKQVPSSFAGKTAGTLETVSANTLGDDDGNWGLNFGADASQPYFIKITSGDAEGRFFQVGTTNSATVINLASGEDPTGPTTGSDVSTGDSYEIVSGYTLSSFFALIDVIEGTSAGAADNVYILNDGSWDGPNFRNTSGDWKKGFFTTNTTVLRPDSGFLYVRKTGSGDLTLVDSGVVPEENQKFVIPAGTSNFVSINFPTDTTLLGTGLQNSLNWVTNTDRVYVLVNGSWTPNVWNGTNWKNGFFTTDTTPIVAGQALYIIKSAGSDAIYSRIKPY